MPLEVGKEWRFDNNGKNLLHGFTWRTTGQSKVTAQEKVTTSAGTFETFKIETVMRHVSSTDATKSATVTNTLWYAPTVNRWVRKVYKLEREGRVRRVADRGCPTTPETVAPGDMDRCPSQADWGHRSSGDDLSLPETFAHPRD
jgi:hypothetical protein